MAMRSLHECAENSGASCLPGDKCRRHSRKFDNSCREEEKASVGSSLRSLSPREALVPGQGGRIPPTAQGLDEECGSRHSLALDVSAALSLLSSAVWAMITFA